MEFAPIHGKAKITQGREVYMGNAKAQSSTEQELHPRAPVRRFDVFAEYNRQEAIQKGTPEDEAAGYGLWVAKVVASRGFGRRVKSQMHGAQGGHGDGQDEEEEAAPKPKWHSLGNEEQTDELFDKEVVRRMGHDFYEKVFAPAIRNAIEQNKSYTAIRDSIRKGWTV